MEKAELLPRIHGTEIEYGLNKSDAIRLTEIEKFIPSYLERLGQYLTNGSRLYVDVGEHPEYASPESASFLGTRVAEIAGEIIVKESLDSMVRAEKLMPGFRLHKRVIDSNGTPHGAHESYLTFREVDPSKPRIQQVLVTHFVTRSILFGAGCYDGEQWRTVQKLPYLDRVAYGTSHTPSQRPIIDLRQEALADDSIWRRLHVTCGDANMSPWATWMKLASTSLIIRLLEANEDLSDLYLFDAFDAINTVAKDTSLQATIKTVKGDSLSALEIQKQLVNRIESLSEKVLLPPEELRAIEEWKTALIDAENNVELLADRVDWVAKRAISEEIAEPKSREYRRQNLAALDQLYDLLDEKRGIGLWLRRIGRFRDTPGSEEIDSALLDAPSDTRALLRGRLILAASTQIGKKKLGNLQQINWCGIKFANTKQLEHMNPYVYASHEVEQIISSVES